MVEPEVGESRYELVQGETALAVLFAGISGIPGWYLLRMRAVTGPGSLVVGATSILLTSPMIGGSIELDRGQVFAMWSDEYQPVTKFDADDDALASLYLDYSVPSAGVMTYVALDPPIRFGPKVPRAIDFTSRLCGSMHGFTRYAEKRRAIQVIRVTALTPSAVIGGPSRLLDGLAPRMPGGERSLGRVRRRRHPGPRLADPQHQ